MGALQAASMLKLVTDSLPGKDLQLSIDDDRSTNGRMPCVVLSTKMVKGQRKHTIYQGNDPYVARDIASRATVCSEAQKRELKAKLPRGFNIAPGLDGDYILFGRDNAKRYEGDLNECLTAVFYGN